METITVLGALYIVLGALLGLIQALMPHQWCAVVGPALHKLYPEWSFEQFREAVYQARQQRTESALRALTHSLAITALWPVLVYILCRK